MKVIQARMQSLTHTQKLLYNKIRMNEFKNLFSQVYELHNGQSFRKVHIIYEHRME